MIVECPGCRNRYDVTGRPPGTRARCRCGTVFELPEPFKHAAVLECPRCGGHVAATNHTCEFCDVALMVKACPRCFARMFHGSKHCSQCGASVVAPASANLDGDAQKRKCPRCTDSYLVARLIGDVLLDDCPNCLGTFVDVAALEHIVSKRKQTQMQAMWSALAPQGTLSQSATEGEFPLPTMPTSGSAVYVQCPDCKNLMNRRNFAKGTGVIVDVCRAHGTWFDKDELAHVIDFAMRGGLARVEQRELERQAEEERKKRVSQRITAMKFEHESAERSPTLAAARELFRALGGFLSR